MSQGGRARTWVLTFVVAAVAGLGGLIGIGCAVGANTCPFSDPPRQSSTDGAVLFRANCAVCHGPDGSGGTGPSLVAGSATALTPAELEARIARGRPLAGMPAFKRTLSPEQISAVAEFVDALREAETSPGGTPS